MYIILIILRNIIVKHCFNIIYINTASSHICRNQDIRLAVSEALHHAVTLRLIHVTMKSLGKISSALEYLCQLIHLTLCVAEHKGKLWLIVIQKAREHFNFILPLNIKIILLNLRYRQFFFHNLNHLCVRLLVILGDFKNFTRHGCGEQNGLTLLVRNILKHCLNVLAESHIEHLISFVKHNCINIITAYRLSAQMVHNTPRRTDNNLCSLQCPNLLRNILPAIDWEHLHAMHIFCKLPDFLRCLYRKLARRAENKCLWMLNLLFYFFKHRNPKCSRFSGTGLRLPDNIRACHCHRNCLALNRRRLLKAHLLDRTQNLRAQI